MLMDTCSSRNFSVPPRFAIALFVASACMTAYAEAPCPGYVETDGGSAFDIAAIVQDAGSQQTALARIRGAVSKIDAGGGCSIFSDRHACEETLTLAHKAIVVLQACSFAKAPKGAAHG
jgi:hypothetical protein